MALPRKTLDLIAAPVIKGERHEAAKAIALSMMGNGCSSVETFSTLRQKFEADVTDSELTSLIQWVEQKHPVPTTFNQRFHPPLPTPPPKKSRPPAEHTAWWLSKLEMDQDAFVALSQLAIPPERQEAVRLFFEMLYQGTDNLNVVCQHVVDGGKARPDGPGRILSRDKWLEYFAEKSVPSSNAGAWFRPNPVKAQGSGKSGAVTDSDVLAFRFLLLESDVLSLPMQFALFAKLKLPISAAYLSGALSVHGLVRVDAANGEEYEKNVRRIISALAPFGIDQANKNPSRLSRLPSAMRIIGAVGDGCQRLLWLNPGKLPVTEADITAFEESLLLPAIEEKPFRRIVRESADRFDELIKNRGKLGVMTGFSSFDKKSGGLKPGGYTVVAGRTGSGKSTVAINIIHSVVTKGDGVALFSLELSREDVADMLFSLHCHVDRNLFNTGELAQRDVDAILLGAETMKNWNLWIYDDPDTTINILRRKVLALSADNLIKLVVVDYAQLVLSDERADNREQAVAAVAVGMRILSRQTRLPIILLSQLNDDGLLRESRRLSHEAANVFSINRETLSSPEITLCINKGRNIPSDPIQLYMKADYCSVKEVCKIKEEDIPKIRNYSD